MAIYIPIPIGVQFLDLPNEILDPLLKELDPSALHAVVQTCTQLFNLVMPGLRKEYTKVTCLEERLIEEMSHLSLQDAITVPTTKNIFKTRQDVATVIPLYAELFQLPYERVRKFVYGHLDDKDINFLFDAKGTALLPKIANILQLPDDTEDEKSAKAKQLFTLLQEISSMKFVAKELMNKQIDLLARIPQDGEGTSYYEKLSRGDLHTLELKKKKERIAAIIAAVAIVAIAAVHIGVAKGSPLWAFAYLPALLLTSVNAV